MNLGKLRLGEAEGAVWVHTLAAGGAAVKKGRFSGGGSVSCLTKPPPPWPSALSSRAVRWPQSTAERTRQALPLGSGDLESRGCDLTVICGAAATVDRRDAVPAGIALAGRNRRSFRHADRSG